MSSTNQMTGKKFLKKKYDWPKQKLITPHKATYSDIDQNELYTRHEYSTLAAWLLTTKASNSTFPFWKIFTALTDPPSFPHITYPNVYYGQRKEIWSRVPIYILQISIPLHYKGIYFNIRTYMYSKHSKLQVILRILKSQNIFD